MNVIARYEAIYFEHIKQNKKRKRHSRENGNLILAKANQSLTYNPQHKTYNLIYLGLSAAVHKSTSVPALRCKCKAFIETIEKINIHEITPHHNAIAQRLQLWAFRFNRAAVERLKSYCTIKANKFNDNDEVNKKNI